MEDKYVTFSIINSNPGVVIKCDTPEQYKEISEWAIPAFKALRKAWMEHLKSEQPVTVKNDVAAAHNASHVTTGDAPNCPICHGGMWDNRPKKADGTFSPTSPDFKCKNKDCKGIIWPPKK